MSIGQQRLVTSLIVPLIHILPARNSVPVGSPHQLYHYSTTSSLLFCNEAFLHLWLVAWSWRQQVDFFSHLFFFIYIFISLGKAPARSNEFRVVGAAPRQGIPYSSIRNVERRGIYELAWGNVGSREIRVDKSVQQYRTSSVGLRIASNYSQQVRGALRALAYTEECFWNFVGRMFLKFQSPSVVVSRRLGSYGRYLNPTIPKKSQHVMNAASGLIYGVYWVYMWQVTPLMYAKSLCPDWEKKACCIAIMLHLHKI